MSCRGIIPARAGFTLYWFGMRPDGADHPRSRGVYPSSPHRRLQGDGSSPLARGLRSTASASATTVGIIPARAGFTTARTQPPRRRRDHPRSRGVYRSGRCPPRRGWDHPRSRGVYSTGQHHVVAPGGSSPLARGLRATHPRSRPRTGIIPARAGFTLADPWNPNDEPHYQTTFAFTADLALAPQSSDSVVVSQRSTRTPSEA